MAINETSILIAEDDPELMIIFQSILSKYFTHVYSATNGKIAEELAKEKKPDIIVTDIEMPEENGLSFALKMRALGDKTPIILVSGSKNREYLLQAIKVGIQNYIEKPFRAADLEAAVHRALEISTRENDLPELISKYGNDSTEVIHQRKMIGLLTALNSKN